MAATLIEYSLATASQFAEISAAGNALQVITADQVSEAAFPSRYPAEVT
jgi:hypothetical protein